MENTLNIDDIEKKDKYYTLPLNFKTDEEKLFLVRDVKTNFSNYKLINKKELLEYKDIILEICEDTKNNLLSDLERLKRLVAFFIVEGIVKDDKLYINKKFFSKIEMFLKESQYIIENEPESCKHKSLEEYKIIYISDKLKEKSIKL